MFPAIVIVPVRAAPVFAAAVKVTDPLPLPEAPLVMLSHDALLEAVQAHPAGAVTPMAMPSPPVAAID